MDINAKIAARRTELANQELQNKEAEQKQRIEALDKLAAKLATEDKNFVRVGDQIALTRDDLPPLDVEGLTRSAVSKLVNEEARRLWTTQDNWIIIGCIVGGLTTIHLGGLGFIPLGIGLWARHAGNKRYRGQVRERLQLPS